MWEMLKKFAVSDEIKNSMDHSLSRLPQGELSVQTILNWIYAMFGMLAVGFIVFGAIQLAMAQGDPGKIRRGKESITFAAIGLVVVLLAAVITNYIYGVFG